MLKLSVLSTHACLECLPLVNESISNVFHNAAVGKHLSCAVAKYCNDVKRH